MPTFPSVEWIDAFCGELERHPQAAQTAAALDGIYRFVVEPAGPLRSQRCFDVRITVDAGDASVQRVADLDGEPRLTLSADYERWRQLIRGELDIGLALMLRRLRVAGDLAGVRGGLRSVDPLLKSLRSVDSQWLGTTS